jgi:ABC-type multidrug transport system ATPase subunit
VDADTAGVDPQTRRDTPSVIEQVGDRGVMVVLVTRFMDAAGRLCDRRWTLTTTAALIASRLPRSVGMAWVPRRPAQPRGRAQPPSMIMP